MPIEQDCKACLMGIGDIKEEVGEIKGILRLLNGNTIKIVFALLAVVGANVGTKYIGTPWYIYMAMYAAMFSVVFVLLISISKWRCLNVWEKVIRISFVLSVLYSSGLRIYHYQVVTPMTQLEGVLANMLNLSLAIGFIGLAWTRDHWRRPDRRRYDDVLKTD